MPGIPLMNYDTRECKQVMMVVTTENFIRGCLLIFSKQPSLLNTGIT